MTRVVFDSRFQIRGSELWSDSRDFEMIAPTPFEHPSGERISIYFGSRDGEGRASIFAADVDLGAAEIVSDTARLVCGPENGGSFAVDGMLPTDARRGDGDVREVIYSGFVRASGGIRLQSGVIRDVSAEAGIRGLETAGRRLFSPSLTSVSLCAGASWSRVQPEWVYFARGDGYWEGDGSRHPVSSIARGKIIDGEVHDSEVILEPDDGEFALTRPFHFEIGGEELLLFSARTTLGAYVQRLAVWTGSSFERIPFSTSGGELGAVVYGAPFVVGDSNWCVFSGDYLGGSTTTFCRVDVHE